MEPMLINDPETIAELKSLYPKYEQALMANDVPSLMSMFWPSPHAVRFGASENLYGEAEIQAFRKQRPAVNLARKIKRLEIASFGRDFGSITIEFERYTDEKIVHGRQSQVWVRFPDGWRIVSAHISYLA